jgi:hypothetical protein
VSASLIFSGAGAQTPAFLIGALLGNNGFAVAPSYPSANTGTIKTGRMAHAAYYNVALSPADVTAHYTAGMTVPS